MEIIIGIGLIIVAIYLVYLLIVKVIVPIVAVVAQIVFWITVGVAAILSIVNYFKSISQTKLLPAKAGRFG
jgi:hypothetical protein